MHARPGGVRIGIGNRHFAKGKSAVWPVAPLKRASPRHDAGAPSPGWKALDRANLTERELQLESGPIYNEGPLGW